MFDWLTQTTGLDDFAILQIIALSAVCGFMVSQVLDGWMAMFGSYVGLLICGIGANITGRKVGLIITANKHLDGILFTTGGLILGALAAVGGILMFSALNTRVGRSAQAMRAESDAKDAKAAMIAAVLKTKP